MRLILVRHGQSLANEDESHMYRQTDAEIPLSDLGKTQAQNAGQVLQKIITSPLDVFVSSHERTRQTWRIIKTQLDSSLIKSETISKEIIEQEFNLSDERNHEGFKNRRQHKHNVDFEFHGGESIRQTYQRAERFVGSCLKNPGHDVLIVSHGRFLQVLRLVLLKLPVDQYHEKYFQNCEVFDLTV